MSDQPAVVIVGGTRGIGLEIVRHFAERGDHVVLTGRDAADAVEVARGIGGHVTGVGLRPHAAEGDRGGPGRCRSGPRARARRDRT